MADPVPTKPYLLRALYEWCVDNGYTPYLAVKVDARDAGADGIRAQRRDHAERLPAAVHKLQMGNELIEFSARFGGVRATCRSRSSPVAALYARENGHGMTFETGRKETAWEASGEALSKDGAGEPEPPSARAAGSRTSG